MSSQKPFEQVIDAIADKGAEGMHASYMRKNGVKPGLYAGFWGDEMGHPGGNIFIKTGEITEEEAKANARRPEMQKSTVMRWDGEKLSKFE
ncbi:MAG TPA: hypothetical protein DCX25_02125 [Candidatus Pacebacteria bacterium]|nr:MAG: hypothetical protein UX00_C0014G0027 [Microgenomates group bacterium GW2011_GWB1_45_17]KKU23168.1 MAG: hypothetical protein UX35_C0010G0086 [Microgenomates group bacterium GW2011_GWA1_46_15]KKU23831.1 MAG: hypothetical protein UX36_C0003G0131 [Microgenomates group bacterium GW2011_GWC1_46_15]HAV15102.1 hypothetical protein [Candidatus Paceibacterota bacterium]HCR11639.1 hypothetical protein [Candidatus Paceibacterota bacterium]